MGKLLLRANLEDLKNLVKDVYAIFEAIYGINHYKSLEGIIALLYLTQEPSPSLMNFRREEHNSKIKSAFDFLITKLELLNTDAQKEIIAKQIIKLISVANGNGQVILHKICYHVNKYTYVKTSRWRSSRLSR